VGGRDFSRAETFSPRHPEQARRSEATERAARDLQVFCSAQRFTSAITVLFWIKDKALPAEKCHRQSGHSEPTASDWLR